MPQGLTAGDTIFALSSGRPPAAIAVIRVSGPRAGEALRCLAGTIPPPRRAVLADLRGEDGDVLDRGLILWFPGPESATGEDCAEFHLHGGRAVIAAVERALAALPGFRTADAGEFTRRSFANGRIDLMQTEGLADLLTAETELQRRNAQALAQGVFSRQVLSWRDTVLALSAQIEAVLDFADEDDVGVILGFDQQCDALRKELLVWLDAPSAERLREGFRVAIAGPPNAGKSTLFNALVGEDAAIATPIPGTTRDVLLRPVAINGIPFTFIDTAGLRDQHGDEVEAIGIARALAEIERADCVLWLGAEGGGPEGALEIESRIDLVPRVKEAPAHRVSAVTGEGVRELRDALIARAQNTMPKAGETAISGFQRRQIADAATALADVGNSDPILQAEALRSARVAFDRLAGRADTESMLDALFGRFCIGK